MPTDDSADSSVLPSDVRDAAPSSATAAPSHASAPAIHESYTERLRRLGARVTPQRLFVLEALESVGGHMTAEDIMQWASRRYPALNLATVYRTLDLLISVGLVAQTDLGGGAATYELVGDSPHHHLACERCGYVIEMDESLIADLCERMRDVYGFHAQPRHLAIFGVCRACYEAEQATS